MIALISGIRWQLLAIVTFALATLATQSDLASVAASLAATGAIAVMSAFGVRARTAALARVAKQYPAVRDRHHRSAFIPQCDPAAPGRPRPRAPGRHLHR